MSACEWCWAMASKRAIMRGGATGDHYQDVLTEQERLGPQADCPVVRDSERPGPEGARGA